MKDFIGKLRNCLLYGFISILPISFLFGGISNADHDLLSELSGPSQDNIIYRNINAGSQVRAVGNRVINFKDSVILRVTRFLLILTISLSVTMILYNGMVYIIQTGQGKDGKSLMKNVVLIVVGILVALFSVIIINLIQSITTTLNSDTELSKTPDTDSNILGTPDKDSEEDSDEQSGG